MKFTYKLNIILGSLLLTTLIIIFLLIFFQIRKKNKQIQENEIILEIEKDKNEKLEIELKDRNKQIENLKKEKPQTEKEKECLELLDNDTIIINDLKDDKENCLKNLEKTNEILKSMNKKKNDLIPFGLVGFDTEMNLDIYAGLLYNRKIYSGRLIDFGIGFGGAGKIGYNFNNFVYNQPNIGGAGIIQFKFSF